MGEVVIDGLVAKPQGAILAIMVIFVEHTKFKTRKIANRVEMVATKPYNILIFFQLAFSSGDGDACVLLSPGTASRQMSGVSCWCRVVFYLLFTSKNQRIRFCGGLTLTWPFDIFARAYRPVHIQLLQLDILHLLFFDSDPQLPRSEHMQA